MRATLARVSALAWCCSFACIPHHGATAEGVAPEGLDESCLVQSFFARQPESETLVESSPPEFSEPWSPDAPPTRWVPEDIPLFQDINVPFTKFEPPTPAPDDEGVEPNPVEPNSVEPNPEYEGVEPPRSKAVARTEYFGNVRVYGFDRSTDETAHQEWMMLFPQNYTAAKLEDICLKLAQRNAVCDYVGHPDSAGLALLNVNAPVQVMRKSAVLCPEASYMEVDRPTKKLPTPVLGPAYPKHHVPWGLDRIDQRQGTDGLYLPFSDGAGVHIFHLDTGIAVSSGEFEHRALPRLDMTKADPRTAKKYTECRDYDIYCASDLDGHGTHTAGTIASKTFGVAKKATIHAVKVLDDHGAGSWAWFISAMDWVLYWTAKNNVKPVIISASLGGAGRMEIVKDAIERTTEKGVAVVVAAGNENMDACYYTPAYIPSAITVGSMGPDDKRSSFSNYGTCVDLFAPGQKIVSLSYVHGVDGTGSMSGTSMAAPHVAGAAALYMATHPSMSIQSNMAVSIQSNMALATQQRMKAAATEKILTGMLPRAPQNKLLYVGNLDAPQPRPLPPIQRQQPPPWQAPQWLPSANGMPAGAPNPVLNPMQMPILPGQLGGAVPPQMLPGQYPGGAYSQPPPPRPPPIPSGWPVQGAQPVVAELDPAGPLPVGISGRNVLPAYPMQLPPGMSPVAMSVPRVEPASQQPDLAGKGAVEGSGVDPEPPAPEGAPEVPAATPEGPPAEPQMRQQAFGFAQRR